jgi:isopenicillin N synthase-like dioxygenase
MLSISKAIMAATTSNFSAIPILDYSLVSSPATRTKFLDQLRDSLINVGFLYLSNHPIPRTDIDLLVNHIPKLFDLPQDAKEKISKIHSPSFFGYARFGAELTNQAVDQREQFDFGIGNQVYPWKEGDPEFYKMLGPCQVRSKSDKLFRILISPSGQMKHSSQDLEKFLSAISNKLKISVMLSARSFLKLSAWGHMGLTASSTNHN